MKKGFLVFILLIGLFFRLNNLDWDDNHHLHPDERFLTMVSSAMRLPKSFNEYFDQKISPLNPANIGYRFYVYGHFPLILNKYLAVFLKRDNYNDLTILGRYLSAFFDWLVIILIFKIGKILFKDNKSKNMATQVAILASFFYAIFVLPIQLAHFFAVDAFLNFFMIGSFYFILRFLKGKKAISFILSAFFFSLALGSKITAIVILPLLIVFIFFIKRKLPKKFFLFFLYFLLVYFSLRLFDPYYFENKNFFNPTVSFLFAENIKQLKDLTRKSLDNWYPPMVQWLSKNSLQHSIVNNIVFGMGIIQSIFMIIGIALILLPNLKRQNLKPNNYQLITIIFWMIGVFVYQSLQATPTLRYFIYLYPFFALFCGYGAYWFLKELKKIFKNKLIFRPSLFTFYLLVFLWPLMFSSIYFKKHTRVEASEWIYRNLPNRSIILGESWDDPLPLYLEKNYWKEFMIEQLPVFDSDSDQKWQRMRELLNKADYYVLSSNRGWGSISTVPEKYPKMSVYYRALLKNNCKKQREMVGVCYQKIKEFTSYPTLKLPIFPFELSFNDQWADESFTVYDHPKVIILKKINCC